ncbi:ribonuclease J, partial [Candidatus Parcubacteria bacterium]|nr:ribonuclease J [Candidatus Parcubacteria bacterium]
MAEFKKEFRGGGGGGRGDFRRGRPQHGGGNRPGGPGGPSGPGGASSSHRIVRRTAKFGGKPQGSRPHAPERIHKIPDVGENIRIIHLGGVEEVGRNMSLIEYKDTIIVVDCGFMFSEDSTPGIDYILPNTKYLEERKGKVKALIITHGHLDHIGAIPYVMERIGNPPLYTRQFTSYMIKKRQEEFPQAPALDMRIVEKNERVHIGDLSISFFGVSHSIPDAMGIIVETPYGDIVHTGDLRLDHAEGEVSEMEGIVYDEFKDRNVLLLQADSTNAENPGFSISEKLVQHNIEAIIRDAKNRLIVSTFASQVERMLKMIDLAEKYGRKVVVEGRSMKSNIEVAKAAGLLKAKPGTLIDVAEMANYPENKIMALVTGAQGEEFAALMRISNKTHKYIKLTPKDTILMSSSVIPGNEREVQRLKDNLSRQGAHIIHYKTSDVHSSGHANAEELAWIHAKIHPKYFIPIHGYHYMLRVHADIAKRIVAEGNTLIPDNGMII